MNSFVDECLNTRVYIHIRSCICAFWAHVCIFACESHMAVGMSNAPPDASHSLLEPYLPPMCNCVTSNNDKRTQSGRSFRESIVASCSMRHPHSKVMFFPLRCAGSEERLLRVNWRKSVIYTRTMSKRTTNCICRPFQFEVFTRTTFESLL